MNKAPWWGLALTVAVLRAGDAPPAAAPQAERALGPKSATVEPWRPLFRGIEYAKSAAEKPRPLKVHAIRIDLREPTIEFLVTPSNKEAPLETNGARTSTFLKQNGCQLAINASPYAPVLEFEGKPQDVLGLSVSRGDAYSAAADSYGALLIAKDNKVRIAMPPFDAGAAHNAVGGFRMLLKGGENVADDDQLHPRTAAGVTQDGRYLVLVAIDGRQRGYSEGTSTAETAEWMRLFGCFDAVNLDGGGSTSLVIADGKGGATVLNRPIHAGIPSLERVVANHLGVFAKPLEKR